MLTNKSLFILSLMPQLIRCESEFPASNVENSRLSSSVPQSSLVSSDHTFVFSSPTKTIVHSSPLNNAEITPPILINNSNNNLSSLDQETLQQSKQQADASIVPSESPIDQTEVIVASSQKHSNKDSIQIIETTTPVMHKNPSPAKTLTPNTHYIITEEDSSTSLSIRSSEIVLNHINESSPINSNASSTLNEDSENYQIDTNTHFLSFEEWKKQKGVESNKDNEPSVPLRSNQPIAIKDNGIIGEEMEIDLSNFFSVEEEKEDTIYKKFNYASFDCAATIVKTNSEAKGVTSILFENKDSYLLNPCSAPSKFIVIELCQDILVDSFVLANLEFFSSTFKKVSIAVSDTFPVQKNGWTNLGIFSAQDVRDYQTFNIENPRIWAKYVKIEILEHYGTEFYCPLTVVRVHGRTMMQEYKQEESLQHNGESKDKNGIIENQENDKIDENDKNGDNEVNNFHSEEQLTQENCETKRQCVELKESSNLGQFNTISNDFNVNLSESISSISEINECSLPSLKFDELFQKKNKCDITNGTKSSSSNSTSQQLSQPSQSPPSSGTQESIYKNIMKRLSLLESNATLSVLYIEEQSKLLSTAFTNLEKKHANNLNKLIATFNSTVNEQIHSLTGLYHILQHETRSIFSNQRSSHEQLLSDAYYQIEQLTRELKFQKFLGTVNFIIICGILIYVVLTRDTYIDTEYVENDKVWYDEQKRKITSTGSRIKANLRRYYSCGSTPNSPVLSNENSENEAEEDKYKRSSSTIDKNSNDSASELDYDQPPTPAYSDGEE